MEPRQALEVLIGPVVDSTTNLLIAANNFMNSNTNIAEVDKFTKSFTSWMNSGGMLGTMTYSTIYMSFWVIYDAIAWFFRFNEDRHRQRIQEIKDELDEDNEAVEEMISTLNVANERLNTFKKSLLILICEKIDKSAMEDGKILIKRNGLERQIDCSSLLRKRVDVKENNEGNEDDENVDGATFEHSKNISKEAIIPDEPNNPSYSNSFYNGVDTHDNQPEASEQNYKENIIADTLWMSFFATRRVTRNIFFRP